METHTPMTQRITPVRLAGANAWFSAFAFSGLLVGCASQQPAPNPYFFAWSFPESAWNEARGGSSRGPDVKRDTIPNEAWKRIQQAETPFDKDRAAILAMSGDYRASFNFLETAVFRPDGKAAPAQPYRSWGTERVYVVADSSTFLSLQHILVQFFLDDKGVIQGPMVMKHWRQDWRFEPAAISTYQGNRVWQKKHLAAVDSKGAWSQSVFQVDDSPRYASVGRWEHNASFSSWSGSRTLRPPPRREFTVRTDYQALDAINRHTILPTGWVHDQDNLKLVLDSAGRPDGRAPYVARESGVERYDRILGFDFLAGDSAWNATSPYWTRVRAQWEERLSTGKRIRISETCGTEPAYALFFGHADSLSRPPAASRQAIDVDVKTLLDCLVSPAE